MAAMVWIAAALQAFAAPAAPNPHGSMLLSSGWQLHTACRFAQDGRALSTAPVSAAGWMKTQVPGTVLAAQVKAGVYPDPFFAMNLRRIPGESYPIGKNFSNLPMPSDSPYACGWWYRDTFQAPSATGGKTTWLHLGGINYRADLWLNGVRVADTHDIAGAYRTYDLDVSKAVHGGRNVLAIEVFAPGPSDLGVNWVDWNPAPPDKDMGITGPVALRVTGAVAARAPSVVTHFTDDSLREAALTVYGDVTNATADPVSVTVRAQLLHVALEQPVTLAPHETKTVAFTPEQFPQLRLALKPQDTRIWWPYVMGAPHLEPITLTVLRGKAVSDAAAATFGIREVTSSLTAQNHRQLRVNGRRILIRGGGWSQDMLLREDPQRLREQFALAQDVHLNAIRLEGKLETDDFFRLADERGMLILAGWCCCDRWERWSEWTAENHAVAEASLRAQMQRLRGHPSLLVWLNGSDNNPPPDVETAYLDIEKEEHWPNPVLSSASAHPTSVTGQSGVKMTGPYDFVAPSYWLADTGKYGGAYGFNTETGPGPAIPNRSSLERYLPTDAMWPRGNAWNYHNGSEHFSQLTVFDTAMQHTYGEAHSLGDYERYAQAMAYDGERAMFEAYGKRKYNDATGIVQWMLNNAWPSTIWHLYDYYLDAAGGYYGARKANEPLHVQYSYDDHSIVVVNSTYRPAPQMQVTAKVYDLGLKELYTKTAAVSADADATVHALDLPAQLFPRDDGALRFVALTLKAGSGRTLSQNFYWIPGRLTTFDWARTDFAHTPASTYENLTALSSLPQARITATLSRRSANEVAVTLRNPDAAQNGKASLAFLVSLRAQGPSGGAVDPAFWSDNYISLLPGESRTLRVHADQPISQVLVSGWNVAPQMLRSGSVQRADQATR